MPIIEIFMHRGRTQEEITAIADAVHDALVEAYQVPREDRFQIVRQCEDYELIADPTFMGGPRTNQFLLVRVTAGKSRPREVKRAFFKSIVDRVGRLGVPKADVLTIVDNVTLSDLSLADGEAFDVVLAQQGIEEWPRPVVPDNV